MVSLGIWSLRFHLKVPEHCRGLCWSRSLGFVLTVCLFICTWVMRWINRKEETGWVHRLSLGAKTPCGSGTGRWMDGLTERSDFEGFQRVRSLLQQFPDLLQWTQVAALHLFHCGFCEGSFRLDEKGIIESRNEHNKLRFDEIKIKSA